MSFIDEVKIFIAAGNGGNGCVSFRREKFVEFGGPDGGNGGNGGSVFFRAVSNINTLLNYRHLQRFEAQNGAAGTKRRRTGGCGDDLILKVPLGTQIFHEDGKMIVDLCHEGQTHLVGHGGRGGAGNAVFKNSIDQAPRMATAGKEGDNFYVVLKLKLLCDVGLVGLPNAGKSSFLQAVTSARPKIGNYPFTTLCPSLGVAFALDDNECGFVIADLPGIIQGASVGAGLGHRFLKHIERSKIFLHLIDISQDDIITAYDAIIHELLQYERSLINKEMIIGLTKCDLLDEEECYKRENMLKRHIVENGIMIDKENTKIYLLGSSNDDENAHPAFTKNYKKLINNLWISLSHYTSPEYNEEL